MLIQIHQYWHAFQQSVRQMYTEWRQREALLAQIRRQLAIPHRRIWCCFIGSTLIWAAYLVTVYALPSLACQWQWVGAPDTGNGLKLLQFLISVVAAGVIAGSGTVVFADWQHASQAGYHEFSQAQAEPILPCLLL